MKDTKENIYGNQFIDYSTSYNNKLAVSNSDYLINKSIEEGKETYLNYCVRKDIYYGADERQRLDWFSTEHDKKGTLIFIHGGYWQNCRKEDFASIANSLLDQGFDVILLEYTLAPHCTLTRITEQIGEALDFIQKTLDVTHPVYLSGHSAGGHLTAYWQQHPLIRTSFAISGIFDLSPLQRTALNINLKLTDNEIIALSPLRKINNLNVYPTQSLILLYGAYELYELVNQSLVYYQAIKEIGYPTTCIAIPSANHFDILHRIFSPEGEIIKILNNQI